jgi:glutaredoxin 3
MSKMFSSLPKKVESLVNKQIAFEKVLIYSKTYCPFATKAKKLLIGKGLSPTVVELDTIENGKKMQEALESITGQKTVPSIFVGGMHVGGSSELIKSDKSGVLDSMLKLAGVKKPYGIPVSAISDPIWVKEGYGSSFKIGGENFNITVSAYGATLISLKYKQKEMTLNWMPESDPGCLINHDKNPYYGATCGRVAGRIENAKFTLPNGKECALA